jgi:hypothetical protein
MSVEELRDSADLLRPDLSDEEWLEYCRKIDEENRKFKQLPQEEQDRIHAENWDPGPPDKETE